MKQEIRRLEDFLLLYNKLSGKNEPSNLSELIDSVVESVVFDVHSEGNVTPSNPVNNGDNFLERSRVRGPRRVRSPIKPGDVASQMERIIRAVGRPMTRSEIVEALEARDVPIPFEDKGRYIGTIAWRHKGLFENIAGEGYWLRGEPLPAKGVFR